MPVLAANGLLHPKRYFTALVMAYYLTQSLNHPPSACKNTVKVTHELTERKCREAERRKKKALWPVISTPNGQPRQGTVVENLRALFVSIRAIRRIF